MNIKFDDILGNDWTSIESFCNQLRLKAIEKNIKFDKIVNTNSSYEGCIESIKNDEKVCLTISSSKNDSIFLISRNFKKLSALCGFLNRVIECC